MSSLGDMLLTDTKSNNNIEDQTLESESQEATDEQSRLDRVYPKHVEKNETADTQSNASSTDDYVRELLDPDDRPKNVWHVIEGPKVSQGSNDSQEPAKEIREEAMIESQDGHKSTNDTLDSENVEDKPSQDVDDKSMQDESIENNNKTSDDDKMEQQDTAEVKDNRLDKKDGALVKSDERRHNEDRKSGKSSDRHRSSSHRDRSRERSSRHHRHDRNRDNKDDSSHERHKSRRKRDYSDDDDDNDRRRHRHRDRRRSRSRSRTSTRHRRDRSRSESQSPITKRNSRTILIMQLNPRVHSSDLEEFFSDIGKVREVRLIMDSKTRRHKGIAYIEFEDAASADKAYSLNGQKFFGAPIVIQSAQVERNRSSGDWQLSSSHQTHVNYASTHPSSRSHHHLPPNCYRIYVGGLNVNLTEEMVRSIFEPFGPIVRLELMRDRVTNISRGYAFITYAHIEDGENAVKNLDGFELAGKALRVSKSTDKSERFPATSQDSTRGGGHHEGNSDGRSSRSKDVTASLFELAGHH